MNRRNFFSTLIKGVGVFSILPPAETYSRIWKATRKPIGIYEMLQSPRFDLVTPETLNLVDFFLRLDALKSRREFYCDPAYWKFIEAVSLGQAVPLNGVIQT